MDMHSPVLVGEAPSRGKGERESREKQIPGTLAGNQRAFFPSIVAFFLMPPNIWKLMKKLQKLQRGDNRMTKYRESKGR